VQYAELWSKRRTNAYAPDEAALLRRYVYSRPWLSDMRLDEVKPRHVDRLIAEMRAQGLSDKTITNAINVLKLAFKSAVREEAVAANPIVLEVRALKTAPTVEKETYTPAEVAVLTRHHTIPWPIRVLNALCLFAGLREGEACGRRWRDLSDAAPLSALLVRDQYGGKALKTERPRVVPVHPELAAILEKWATEGFELYTGQAPKPDDFIVPNVSSRRAADHHSRSSFYKAFVKHAEAAGVRPRSLHSTRHTFISLCRRGGARKDVLERVSHNSRGDIVDRYTHLDWEPLCEAVLCLKIDVHPLLQPGTGNTGNSGGGQLSSGAPDSAESPAIADSAAGFNSRRLHPKTAGFLEARQQTRQQLEENLEESRVDNRRRKRRLLSLKEADPVAAGPGLAVCRGLDAALRLGSGDESAREDLDSALAEAADLLGKAVGQ
jgi:integrase